MADNERAGETELDARLRREGDALRTARLGCPDPDLLAARRSEALDDDLRQRLARHVATCDACRRLAADFDALELDRADAAVEHRVARRVLTPTATGWSPLMRVAASLLVASGLGAAWWMLRARPVPPAVVTNHERQSPAPTLPPSAPSSVVALWSIEPALVRLPLSSLGESRGGTGAGPEGLALLEALKPYQAGQYQDAIDRLAVVAREHPSSGEAHFYLGVAQLLTQRPDLAAASLDQAARRLPRSRHSEVAWYQATAEQRMGRVDAARAHLLTVCAVPGAYQAAACDAEAKLR